jgi:osmotically-inducible protein OsmY
VQSQFFLDSDIKGSDINVDTRDGVVTLKGSVETDAEKQMAETIARETEGVTRVVNDLSVTARDRQ